MSHTPADSAKFSECVRNLLVLKQAVVESASDAALAVGVHGNENPALTVDASAVNSATGIKVTSEATGNGAAISVTSSAVNEPLAIDAKGSGSISVGGVSTGPVRVERSLITKTTVFSQGTTTPQTLLAASIAGGIITQVPDVDTSDVTDTAVNIINTCKLTADGDTVVCWLLNWSSESTITIQGGLGVTGFTMIMPPAAGVQLVFRRTSATDVTLYIVGAASFVAPP